MVKEKCFQEGGRKHLLLYLDIGRVVLARKMVRLLGINIGIVAQPRMVKLYFSQKIE